MDINTFLHILVGFIGLVCLAIPFSNDIKKINIKYIIYGILFQLVLAFLLLEIPFITAAFNYLADGVSVLQSATSEGTKFVFGYLGIVDPNNGLIFAFVILPFIIVMSSITAILWEARH